MAKIYLNGFYKVEFFFLKLKYLNNETDMLFSKNRCRKSIYNDKSIEKLR
jgi:hypothetical protein